MVDVRRHHVTAPIKIGSADPLAKFVDRLIQAARMQVDPKEINRPWNSHRGLVSPPARCFQSIWQPAKLGKPSDPVERLQGDVTGRWAFGVRSRVERRAALGFARSAAAAPALAVGLPNRRVGACRSMQEISASVPDWSRERVRKYFDPSRKLLRHLRGYQRARTKGTLPTIASDRLARLLVSRVERRDRGGDRLSPRRSAGACSSRTPMEL